MTKQGMHSLADQANKYINIYPTFDDPDDEERALLAATPRPLIMLTPSSLPSRACEDDERWGNDAAASCWNVG